MTSSSESSNLNLTWEINLSYGVSGAVCGLISCVITLLLTITQSYHTVLQRLLLYLMIATTFNELVALGHIEKHEVETEVKLILLWANTLRASVTSGVMLYLFFLVSHLVNDETLPQFLQSKCQRVSIEVAYVVITPALSLAYALASHYVFADPFQALKIFEICFFVLKFSIAIVPMIAIIEAYRRLPVLLTQQKLLKRVIVISFVYLTIQVLSFSLQVF